MSRKSWVPNIAKTSIKIYLADNYSINILLML